MERAMAVSPGCSAACFVPRHIQPQPRPNRSWRSMEWVCAHVYVNMWYKQRTKRTWNQLLSQNEGFPLVATGGICKKILLCQTLQVKCGRRVALAWFQQCAFALDNLISKSKTSNCWKQIMVKMLIPSKFLTVRPTFVRPKNWEVNLCVSYLLICGFNNTFRCVWFKAHFKLKGNRGFTMDFTASSSEFSQSRVLPNGGLFQGTVAVPCTTPVSMEPWRPLVSCWQQVAILGWKMTMGFLGEFPQFGSKKMRCDWSRMLCGKCWAGLVRSCGLVGHSF